MTAAVGAVGSRFEDVQTAMNEILNEDVSSCRDGGGGSSEVVTNKKLDV